MKMGLTVLLLLTACAATGGKYSGLEAGNVTIYRPNQFLYFSKLYPVKVQGQECELSNGGFFKAQINGEQTVEAATWNFSGNSRIKAKPGDFIKVEFSDARMWGQGAAGLAGGAIGQVATEATISDGPFILTRVSKEAALSELKDLNQDCK